MYSQPKLIKIQALALYSNWKEF